MSGCDERTCRPFLDPQSNGLRAVLGRIAVSGHLMEVGGCRVGGITGGVTVARTERDGRLNETEG
jgi:hypothetical protein